MASEAPCKTQRRYERISLPKGMTVAWYGGGDSQVSRLKTLGSGGLFLLADHVRPVGTTLTLLFEVPGGLVQAEAVVRNISPQRGNGRGIHQYVPSSASAPGRPAEAVAAI